MMNIVYRVEFTEGFLYESPVMEIEIEPPRCRWRYFLLIFLIVSGVSRASIWGFFYLIIRKYWKTVIFMP